jgi:hypothetical protein
MLLWSVYHPDFEPNGGETGKGLAHEVFNVHPARRLGCKDAAWLT